MFKNRHQSVDMTRSSGTVNSGPMVYHMQPVSKRVHNEKIQLDQFLKKVREKRSIRMTDDPKVKYDYLPHH